MPVATAFAAEIAKCPISNEGFAFFAPLLRGNHSVAPPIGGRNGSPRSPPISIRNFWRLFEAKEKACVALRESAIGNFDLNSKRIRQKRSFWKCSKSDQRSAGPPLDEYRGDSHH